MDKTETVFLPGGGDQVPTLLDVVIGMHYIRRIPHLLSGASVA